MGASHPSARLLAGVPPDARVDADVPARLFERYAPYVGRIALRLLGRTSEVEDVVQGVFVEALPRLAEVRDGGALRGWLAVITTRVVARRLRLHRMRQWLRIRSAHADTAEPIVEATAEERVLLGEVYAVLDRVAPAQRIAWVLRYMEGMKLEEVAAACRCSLVAAKRRIAVVQERMHRELGGA